MRILIDEMFGEKLARLLTDAGHDALHVRDVGLGSTADQDVLARAADDGRTLVTENAADFLRLLDQRQSAGLAMVPVLIVLKAGRGNGGALHRRLTADISAWAADNPDPYAHAHWLPS